MHTEIRDNYDAYYGVICRAERLHHNFYDHQKMPESKQFDELLDELAMQIELTKDALQAAARETQSSQSMIDFLRAYSDLRSVYFEVLRKKDEGAARLKH